MRSDAEFFKEEYRRCVEKYRACAPHEARRRKFYERLGASMLLAYKEAKHVSTK